MDFSDDDDGDGEGDESFASHFYKGGSDWSCLVSETDQICRETNKSKKMKQANLFQIWGLQKPSPPPPPSPTKMKSMAKKTNVVGKRLRNGPNTNGSPRACPFYKKLPGTPFTVDAFRYGRIHGCSAYFLTHFHYDHYGGLSKAWSHGPIYCSSLTSRLLTLSLSINPSFIHPLELDKEYTINGIKVTLIEANHCPGAALIHFRLPDGTCYLHTGDFRASKQMQTHPLLVNRRVHVLYLDTTYCNPRYKFPSKEDVLSYVVRITKDFLRKHPKTLIVVGAYSIGKECVYLSIAKALGVKIFASASRRRILQSFGWSDISENLCRDGRDTVLHVLPISSLRADRLGEYLKVYSEHYAAVLAFRPTGWTYSEKIGDKLDLIRPSSKGNIAIYGVPYSEHSSFTELCEFVQFLKPDKIIPTVNVSNAGTREKMQSHFREWLRS
ncbi:PREDICTED: DNA cross-link repair protein SNM1 [Tarenaya hassleriana]|uniref:DNA cross-link repair protein SNM1 n=1 Tax=Tarenaya hassleriana TaxID=28532 RepID=UPI00053C89EB|nr:PREDICTED: DNA cross-link repair protein SNM1 [Tarenaya hassleriana]